MENDEENPLLEHEEKDDDDDEETTNPFQPGGSSTPGEDIPMTTMNREKEKDPYTDETSFIEGNPLSRVLTSNAKAWESLTGMFPDAKATEFEAAYSKTGKLQVKKREREQELSLARELILCLQKTKIQEDKG